MSWTADDTHHHQGFSESCAMFLRDFFLTWSKTDPRTRTKGPSSKSRAKGLEVSQLLLIHQEGSSKISISKLAMYTCWRLNWAYSKTILWSIPYSKATELEGIQMSASMLASHTNWLTVQTLLLSEVSYQEAKHILWMLVSVNWM